MTTQTVRLVNEGPDLSVVLDDLTPDQLRVLEEVVGAIQAGRRKVVLKGYAGTGKSYLLRKLMAMYGHLGATLLAPTNKAVKVLVEDMGLPATTVCKFLGLVFEEGELKLKNGKDSLFAGKLLIVDEASMVPKEQVELLEAQIRGGRGSTLLYVGDPFQLPPVGEKLSKAFEGAEHESRLTNIVRQGAGNPIIELSMMIRTRGFDVDMVRFDDEHLVKARPLFRPEANIARLVDLVNSGGVYTAWTNRTVQAVNQQIHEALYGVDSQQFCVGEKIVLGVPWRVDPMMIEAEHKAIGKVGLANVGDELEILHVSEDEYLDRKVWKIFVNVPNVANPPPIIAIHPDSAEELDRTLKGYAKEKNWKSFYYLKEEYLDIRHTYASTCHKLQGSTYDKVMINVRDILRIQDAEERNRCLYVAVTRARNQVILENC